MSDEAGDCQLAIRRPSNNKPNSRTIYVVHKRNIN